MELSENVHWRVRKNLPTLAGHFAALRATGMATAGLIFFLDFVEAPDVFDSYLVK